MRLCTWRGGCEQTVPNDEGVCSYHAKVRDGFITTTRSEGKEIRDVDLTAPERDAAWKRQRDYFKGLLRRGG